ncbi:MAG: cytochrome b/b6 domain-containing protein [Coriobacteriia bacterium]|nr:cytochrome b/b6 domain-containing protein [Coriobacteriia bacterium]MCL2870709.1 cytochrome b/b6 domain-containing protein [Coriobacteriia bacterium]
MTKYIRRHNFWARFVHWAYAVFGIILLITGLTIFVPGLGELLGVEVLQTSSQVHMIVGILFVVVPIIGYIAKPSNLKHILQNLFRRWDKDDVDFMKFFPLYLFNPKKYNMPKQHYIKSGQRASDIVMYLLILVFMVSGVLMLVGTNLLPVWVFAVAKFAHQLAFVLFAVLLVVHIFLGAGIFQPYRRLPRGMFGDGLVSESDALYHWGHWAEEELASGENVVEKPSS